MMTQDTTHPADQPLGELEVVHSFSDGPMPTGVSVSHTGRIFINFPKWGDDVTFTVAEIVDGEARPYPSIEANSPRSDDDADALVSVQSIVVDAKDRLWILDTGSPLFQKTTPGGPKLVRVDLDTNTVAQTITFDPAVALPTTYLNDVRFDLRRGVAYITDSADSGPNGLIVVNLDSGDAWRRLHNHPSTVAMTPPEFVGMVEGRQLLERTPEGETRPVTMGSDGIAISEDGSRLWYCPLASRHWYSVSTDALLDRSLDDDAVALTVVDEGDKGGGADGLETDDTGRMYATNWEHNAITRRLADGQIETVVHDPRILWPDTMSIATDQFLYFTANQLHRQAKYQGGTDRRQYPYSLFRVAIGAGPVLLA
jgi:sugar lactone lactonase YvrE